MKREETMRAEAQLDAAPFRRRAEALVSAAGSSHRPHHRPGRVCGRSKGTAGEITTWANISTTNSRRSTGRW